MPRLSAALRVRIRRVYVAVLFALGLEIAIGAAVWDREQWRLPILVAVFPTILVAMLVGLLLAGERWKIVRDFRDRHPTILTSLIMGTAAAIVVGFVIGPLGIVIGPLVLGFAVLVGWGAQKVREFLGL